MVVSQDRLIGEEELRGVVRAHGDTATWLKAIKEQLGATTLPQLLAAKGGRLRTASDGELQVLTKVAKDIEAEKNYVVLKRAHGNANGLLSVLLQIYASARIREKACLERQHASAGLRKGAPMDAENLWEGVAGQRCGRSVPDVERGGDALMRDLWEGLNDAMGRRLAPVALLSVKAAVETTTKEEKDGGGEEKEKKKKGRSTKVELVRAVRMVLTTLAAVGSRTLDTAEEGAPVVRDGEGECSIAGEECVLDCSYVDCMELANFIIDRMVTVRRLTIYAYICIYVYMYVCTPACPAMPGRGQVRKRKRPQG